MKKGEPPHDWAVAQPLDPLANISQGYCIGGTGWYWRYFRLEPSDRWKHLLLPVRDENRNFGSTPEHLLQLDWMVRRDCNHPSVILWSVFNEKPSQGMEVGYHLGRRMSAAVKQIDTARPVTTAQSNSDLNPAKVSRAADVAGFNYVYRNLDE